MSDKDGTVIILHVPMIPDMAHLRLIRVRPFPIPLDNQISLMPEVDRDVIGISHSDQTLSAEIWYSDLLECHHIGRTFFCKRQGVLARDADTCLTALHYQKLEKAMRLCELRVTNATEAALQLTDNQYLIYSPKRATAPRVCTTVLMGASVDIPKGISHLELKPGCYVNLPGHRLYADSSVRTPSNQFSYLWDWEGPIQKLHMNTHGLATLITNISHVSGPLHLQDVIEHVEDMRRLPDFGLFNQTLNNVSSTLHQVEDTASNKWNLFSIFIGLLLAALLLLALICTVFYCRFRTRMLRYTRPFRKLLKMFSDLKKDPKPDQTSTPDSFRTQLVAISEFAAHQSEKLKKLTISGKSD